QVWATGKVRGAVFDSTGTGDTQHLSAVVPAVGDCHWNPGADELGTGLESFIRVDGWSDHGHVATCVIQDTGGELVAQFRQVEAAWIVFVQEQVLVGFGVPETHSVVEAVTGVIGE